jgi:hypothetical protein
MKFMNYEPPGRRPNEPHDLEPEKSSDFDRLRDYSRQFEGEFLQGESFPDKEDSADWWKKF